jgi:hypothetical protein
MTNPYDHDPYLNDEERTWLASACAGRDPPFAALAWLRGRLIERARQVEALQDKVERLQESIAVADIIVRSEELH